MASYVDMSLEDIIQKKKKRTRTNVPGKSNPKKPISNQKPIMTDARNKIISKKRNQITDAREKLAELAKQKDARLRLEEMRKKKMAMNMAFNRNMAVHNMPENRGKWKRTIANKEKVFVDLTRQVRSQPRVSGPKVNTRTQIKRQNNNVKKFMESRSIGTRGRDHLPPLKPILRTVENDIVIMDDDNDEDDPMNGGGYGRTSLNRKASLNLKIIAHNSDSRDKRDRHDKPSISRRTVPLEKEKSPPRLPSILKKRPMAALRSDKRSEKVEEPASTEYRIIVSNLRSSVTGGDIQELFGDVGGMLESRLVRPGTAEVIYKSQADAQQAVNLYHNRQLDGQPMNCLLVTPRSAPTSSRSGSKPTLPPSTNSNVEPDLSTFHKVLFSNF